MESLQRSLTPFARCRLVRMTEAVPVAYPEGSQVADGYISAQIKSLDDSVGRGFDRQERHNEKIDQKMDQLVSRSEFKAELGRVDSEARSMKESIVANRAESAVAVEALRVESRTGFKQVEEREEGRRTRNRWAVGAALAGFTLINGAIATISNFLAASG